MISKNYSKRIQKLYSILYGIIVLMAFCTCHSDQIENVPDEQSTFNFENPNILFIFLDDIGKEWFSFYDGSGIETPALEDFAENSIIYENFYSMGLCAPSRVALLTGQYPYNSGFTGNFGTYGIADWHLDQNYYPSFVEHVRDAGYRTSMIGKWTSNNIIKQPKVLTDIGFDEYLVYPGIDPDEPLTQGYHRYNDPYLYSSKNGWNFYEDSFSETVFLDSIKQFYSNYKDDKSFLMYNMILPHAPLTQTPLEPNVTGREGKFKAFVKYIDFIVGEIINHLDDLGILENTCIILTSDNGTSQDLETIYKGKTVSSTNKGKLKELSVNVPFMIRWPLANTKGQTRSDITDLTDIFSTMLELSGSKSMVTSDGVSLVNNIHGLVHEKPFACSMGIIGMTVNDQGKLVSKFPFSERVVRKGNYKAYVDQSRMITAIYNVTTDPFESINLKNNEEHKDIIIDFELIVNEMPAIDNLPSYDPI